MRAQLTAPLIPEVEIPSWRQQAARLEGLLADVVSGTSSGGGNRPYHLSVFRNQPELALQTCVARPSWPGFAGLEALAT